MVKASGQPYLGYHRAIGINQPDRVKAFQKPDLGYRRTIGINQPDTVMALGKPVACHINQHAHSCPSAQGGKGVLLIFVVSMAERGYVLERGTER